MKKVIILKIDTYDIDFIKSRLTDFIHKHFHPKKIFFGQDKILLKPNLLMASEPSEAIVTHPAIVEAVGRIFKEEGYKVFVADCPGHSLSNQYLNLIYTTTGIREVSERLSFDCLYPDKIIIKDNIPFAYWVDDFGMVNLAKLKTHQIMVLTLATKNLYGCVVGLHKSYLHREFPKAEDLSKIILKLYKIINPPLNIVDGIFALEGRGPAKEGKVKKLGIVIVGDDALYTDYVISKLLGLPLQSNPLLSVAKKEGLLEEKVEVISEVARISNFRFPPQFIINYFPPFLIKVARLFFKFRPAIDSKCIGCGMCVKSCPKNAIMLYNKKAKIDYKNCIMCMCCQEACQVGAVFLRRNFLLKILNKFDASNKV
ncbi:MAG: DUF362 domain-containing protein [Candidatus Omnitrophica bacterium]|nr:DUF362 domain-containing protein [Candidatus Omnitrophota bacterium]